MCMCGYVCVFMSDVCIRMCGYVCVYVYIAFSAALYVCVCACGYVCMYACMYAWPFQVSNVLCSTAFPLCMCRLCVCVSVYITHPS